MRPSTARFARAQDEVLFFMPSKLPLILRSARRARLEGRKAVLQRSSRWRHCSTGATEGKILGWLKHEGDSFNPGEELLEIETTKITNVLEASEGGTLRRIVAPAGATLPIGALLAVFAPEEVSESEIDTFVAGFAIPEPSA